jgi:hypothetical protein
MKNKREKHLKRVVDKKFKELKVNNIKTDLHIDEDGNIIVKIRKMK